MIDPRTCKPVLVESECHIIPAKLGVSNLTVRLERDFDNKVGSRYDSQLMLYIAIITAKSIPGRFTLPTQRSLNGFINPVTRTFDISTRIPLKKGRQDKFDPAEWRKKVLGIKPGDSQLAFDSFRSNTVAIGRARLSLIHSAMLMLHKLDFKLDEKGFDEARELLSCGLENEPSASEHKRIEQMTPDFVVFLYDKSKHTGPIDEFRRVFDKNYDPGDGLLIDFPRRCVTTSESCVEVIVPSGKCIRSKVLFDCA